MDGHRGSGFRPSRWEEEGWVVVGVRCWESRGEEEGEGGCSRLREESVRSKMGSSRGWAAVVVGR